MNELYRLNKLSFGYDREEPVFSGLDFSIPLHGVTIITGKNGCGKTTLCRLLTGLNRGYQGSVRLNDKELSALKPAAITSQVLYIKQDITGNMLGAVPDEDLSIWQNRFCEQESHEKSAQRKEALERFGAGEIAHHPIWELSFGQKRKAMLAVLPLFMQKYWIIDEPSAGLDSAAVTGLVKLIGEKTASFCGCLVITHRGELIAELKQLPDMNGVFALTGGKIAEKS